MTYTQPKQITVDTRMPNRGLQRLCKNVCMTLAWPVICLGIALVLCALSGKELFINEKDFWLYLGTVLTTFIAIWALNTNLNSGRMDFSLGATGILAALMASKCCANGDFNTTATIMQYIFLTILFGMLLGAVGSVVYIFTKMPAIVTSLGMCLVFEGLAVIVQGASGNIKYRASGKLAARFMSQPSNIVITLIIVMILMSLIICYSRFGYNKNALVYNQKIAVDTGINEIVSCVVCYVIAGGMIGLYQALTDISNTTMTISVNLGSSATVFRNFLPIFIGSMMMRYSNQIISSFFAVIATSLLTRGLEFAADIGINSYISSLITSVMILGVLVYMVDKNAFVGWVKLRMYMRKQKRLGLDK